MRDHENRIVGEHLNAVEREQYRGNRNASASQKGRDGYETRSVRDTSDVFAAEEVPGGYKDADLDPKLVRKLSY